MVEDADSWMPDWVEKLPGLEVVSIQDASKDEFIHHLLSCMRETHGYGYCSQTRVGFGFGRFIEWKLNTSDGRELPRLWVINMSDALALKLAGQGDSVEEDLDLWRRGIESALHRMGSRNSAPWIAILSQIQPDSHTYDGQRLSGFSSVGGLSFEAFGEGVSEEVRTPFTGIGIAGGNFTHWPVEVRGSTSCYTWDRDGELLTLHRLRRVAALLSLAWDSPWKLREGPRDPNIMISGANDHVQGSSWRPIDDEVIRNGGRTVVVPAWLAMAEAAIDRTPRLGNALLIHQEGLELKRDHSSMALVCFTSAVETVAQVTKKPERCPQCDMVLSSRQRFEDAIRSVLDEERAADLLRAYPQRSKTVHQGKTSWH